MKTIKRILFLSMFLMAFAACREQTTGEKVEDAVEDVADEVEDAADDISQ
jgi:outer membrane lipoprotein-sorting protein